MTRKPATAAPRRSPATILLALVGAVGLASGCSGDERLDPAFISAPGPYGGAEAQPCEPGATRDCYVTLGVREDILTCYTGTQVCADDGTWGECADGEVSEVPVDATALAVGPGSMRPQAYSDTPTSCVDNPCDPFCRTWDETPDLPLEADTDPNSWFFTWPVGVMSTLPSGLYEKGFAEPCTGGWDCQFNSRCVAPTAGSCAHGVCEVGAGLFPGDAPSRLPCDQGNNNNGSCVAAVCAVDPSCCGEAFELPTCADDETEGPNGDYCYYFNPNAVSWTEARQACQDRGAGWDLVDIMSGAENTFVQSLISATSWIGANDRDQAGAFIWPDGTPLAGNYENWAAGEPNDQNTEECTQIYMEGTWNDLPCDRTLRSVCKGPSTTGSAADCSHDPCARGAALKSSCHYCVSQICDRAGLEYCCDLAAGSWDTACVEAVASVCGNSCSCAGGAYYGASCYVHETTAETAVTAAAACRALGAGWDLVAIGDQAENSFVTSTFTAADSVWIGLTDQVAEGTWVWVNGEPTSYTAWDATAGEPDGGTGENCATLDAAGSWSDTPCAAANAKHDFVCEGPTGNMVAEAVLGSTGTWDQDCVDLVADVCVADCNPDDPADVSGQCTPWYAGETDPDCAGVDLAVDVPCFDAETNLAMIPVCNHGNTAVGGTAEADWIRLIHFPANSQQYPKCEPDQTHPGTMDCWVKEEIPPGYCVAVTDCLDSNDNNREIMINPPGANYVEECDCEDNWSLYSKQTLCGPPICEAGTTSATPVRAPVDVVVVIDNSGSMTGEVTAIQDNINNFAATLDAGALDYRVILVTRYGDTGTPVGNSNNPVCVPTPLGVNACLTPATTPLQLNPPRFFHYSVDVGSHDAWCKLLGGYNTSDLLGEQADRAWDPVAPSGWGDWLREDAFKSFIVITDDDSGCTSAGYSFNDSGTAAGGQDAAAAFDTALLALSSAQFGTQAARDYVWHSIVGMPNNGSPSAGWDPSEPIQTGTCGSNSQGPGTGHQAMSILTGGLRYPICDNASFGAIFTELANAVVESAPMQCSFEINPTVPINPSETDVIWQHPNGDTTTLTRVRDAANCTSDGWYYNSPIDPTLLTLCPDACQAIHDEAGSEVFVEIGCAEPAQATSFYVEYEATCPLEGGPQWRDLLWNTIIPDDGAEVQFYVRTAPSQAELADLGEDAFEHVATAVTTNQACDLVTCPNNAYNVYDALDLPDNHYPFLELKITILPGLTAISPLVDSWELNYSCPPEE